MSQIFQDMLQGLTEARQYMEGERKGFKAHVPDFVDVKEIRGKLKMSQTLFSDTFGFSVDAVRHWEAKRRTPEKSARILLKMIDLNPHLVITALAAPPTKAADLNMRTKRQPAQNEINVRRSGVK